MASTPLTPLPPELEMFQKSILDQSLFSKRPLGMRPMSEATEIYDTEFEDESDRDDVVDDDSPRSSVGSFGKKSDTTISSYDEVSTPRSNRFAAFDFQINEKPVEGPRGPHLFRASQDSSHNITFHLSMSPLTPKDPSIRPDHHFTAPPLPTSANAQPLSSLTHAVSRLDPAEVRNWSPRQVAAWMYDAGFEEAVVEKFQRNDISGEILVDLKFEDLKELDIQSFGKRHRLWTEIHHLRGSPLSSPVDGSRPSSLESRRSNARRHGDCSPSDDEETAEIAELRRNRSRKARKPRFAADTVISPAESVSIVGIEQLLPKPHKCSKGERCNKYRKQQRQLALLAQEHPVSPEHGGQIFISGDPGNAATADSMLRPTSEVVPSVVASSDVLGPAQVPEFRLGEDNLRAMQLRDPQENVKHFLSFQHLQTAPHEEPATPPLELFPPLQTPGRFGTQEQLRTLPKLTIPAAPVVSAFSPPTTACPLSPPVRSNSAFSPSRTYTSLNANRHGTPFSEMDVPVTSVPIGPPARDFSQSVPPDMLYRRGSNRLRTESRHPSFAMAKVAEDTILELPGDTAEVTVPAAVKDANHAGWMKKRKTKFLRHEWHENHYTLKGTTLAMRQNEKCVDALEHIDVDDYAVACASIGGSNKLTAALKSMKLAGGSKKDGENAAAPFAFQLVPAAEKKGMKHAALGKTHYFAVKTRDQRIDWMRELMLAKALKQKGEGFDVCRNGNMI
ncbi:MAG: hypothetical protein M1817_003578 [Caeruleum heppii]|nr:MAG: hypothetical protein M1817_003578 [Caeruleum heppii]